MNEMNDIEQDSLQPLPPPCSSESVRTPLLDIPLVNAPYTDFPQELKDLPRWVVWKIENRDGKPTKIPYNAKTGNRASSSDESTWCDYQTAVAKSHRHAGVGFMIAPPYAGIDLDKCHDPETGITEPWAEAIIEELNSYTESSPSRTGFHIWVRGELTLERKRAGRVEMYDGGRYFTITGQHLAGTPLTVEKRDLTSLQSGLPTLDPKERERAEPKKTKPVTVPDPGSKFDALMAGNRSGYPTQSEADAALCALLAAKHNGDAELVDKEFRKSGLMRDKWNEKRGSETYGERTVRNAVEFVRTGGQVVRNPDEPVDWRAAFKSYDQMEQGEMKFLVKGVFPSGVNLIGGLSAAGKTWFALSLAAAMVSGKRFLDNFDVPTVHPVIYLIPESGERSFRCRLDRMRLNTAGERFLCRTMCGPVLGLQSPELIEAVRARKPVVFLDTAIRFSTAQDENNASQNRALAQGMFDLIDAGAPAIVAIHHSPKSSAQEPEKTLENTLRGTGDLGAMSDAVYSLQCVNQATLEVRVQCVKARDFEPIKPFHIQGRPYIDKIGNFGMLDTSGQGSNHAEVEKLISAIGADPSASYRKLAKATGIAQGRIAEAAAKVGWKKGKEFWSQSGDEGFFLN